MTWPSARRTMYGGSLNPESWYSPTSSTPSARRGGVSAAGAGAAEVGAEAAAGGVSVAMGGGDADRRGRSRATPPARGREGPRLLPRARAGGGRRTGGPAGLVALRDV